MERENRINEVAYVCRMVGLRIFCFAFFFNFLRTSGLLDKTFLQRPTSLTLGGVSVQFYRHPQWKKGIHFLAEKLWKIYGQHSLFPKRFETS